MMDKIGLIDYGAAGNQESIRRALIEAGGDVLIVSDAVGFSKVNKLVLPGVGGFHDVMSGIKSSGLYEAILEAAKVKPILGICLGMQMMATLGFEHGETKGLDLVDGEVRKIDCKGPIPHIGFSRIEKIGDSPLFKGISAEDEFYFMHSYEFVNYTDVLSLSSCFGHKFVSAVGCEHIFGVQFHPEKSREAGIKLLKNFINL
jgi:imidazole glycerol phosphate synthase glutamine amidotransferase subunit